MNDVHSQLNRTCVAGIEKPRDVESLRAMFRAALRRGEAVSVCGGRHAGGGQQFLSDRTLIDLTEMRSVLAFDDADGTIDVEAGIRWPTLLDHLHTRPNPEGWSIRQKQGGADELSLGGAIGANIHSRHLHSPPFVADIEQMTVLTPSGELVTCSRSAEPELFRHVIGGYGLFGIVCSLRLRLVRRRKLVRRVEWTTADRAVALLESKRDGGAWHGDFQFAIDPSSDDFCTGGLCSWYEPADPAAEVRATSREDSESRFRKLVLLAHGDKTIAMAGYRRYLEAMNGKVVDYSDDWMAGNYVAGYHELIDAGRGAAGSEILSELHVPRAELPEFLAAAKRILRDDQAELIYGVVRLVEQDDETRLAWATKPFACVIFNLHTQQNAAAIAKNADTFRKLLGAAIGRGGSYYLTYHRFARCDQIERCYPMLRDVLVEKKKRDPKLVLASDWYRHYADLLGV